jgi:hypothetical protein
MLIQHLSKKVEKMVVQHFLKNVDFKKVENCLSNILEKNWVKYTNGSWICLEMPLRPTNSQNRNLTPELVKLSHLGPYLVKIYKNIFGFYLPLPLHPPHLPLLSLVMRDRWPTLPSQRAQHRLLVTADLCLRSYSQLLQFGTLGGDLNELDTLR